MNLESIKTKFSGYADKVSQYHLKRAEHAHVFFRVSNAVCPSLLVCGVVSLLFGKAFAMLAALLMLFFWFHQIKSMSNPDEYAKQNGILVLLTLVSYIFIGRSAAAFFTFLVVVLPFVSYLMFAQNPPELLKTLTFPHFKQVVDKGIYNTEALEASQKPFALPSLMLAYAVLLGLPLLFI